MSRKQGQSPVDIPGRPAATRRVAAGLLTNNENREITGIFCADIMGCHWIYQEIIGDLEDLRKKPYVCSHRRVPPWRCVAQEVPPGSTDSSP